MAPHILLFDIVSVLDLAPDACLPVHLYARRPGCLLEAKGPAVPVRGWLGGAASLVVVAAGGPLAPLDDEPGGVEEALAREDGALKGGELPAVEALDPGADGLAGRVRVAARHDGVAVEDGADGDAGPGVARQVGDALGGGALLGRAQGFVVVCYYYSSSAAAFGRRGPAEEGVGVEVAEERRGETGPDGGIG